MKKLFCALLLIGLCVGTASVASAAEWELIGSNDGESWVFNTRSFKKTGNTTYFVWISTYHSEEKGKALAEKFQLRAPVASTFNKYEFNFRDKMFRLLSSESYDKDNNVLFSNELPSDWNSIPPGSAGALMLKTTYDYYEKHYQ